MENTTQAIAALEAAIKHAQILKEQLLEIEQNLKSVNEPKDGEWYEFTNWNGGKFIAKFKEKTSEERFLAYIYLSNGNIRKNESWAHLQTARKITPEEALPYFKKYFEKQGFKEGSRFNGSSGGHIAIFNSVELSSFDFFFNSGATNVFNNDTNTFATLVEDKVEPLDIQDFRFIADAEFVEFHNSAGVTCFIHSEIEQIYKLSLKAQGK